MMRLRVLLPGEVFLDKTVRKVLAESETGSFCLLPRHLDVVASLVPGLLGYTDETGREEFLALDRGVLIKVGPSVTVSAPRATRGDNLTVLQQKLKEHLKMADEQERHARSALASLEANLVRRLVGLEKEPR